MGGVLVVVGFGGGGGGERAGEEGRGRGGGETDLPGIMMLGVWEREFGEVWEEGEEGCKQCKRGWRTWGAWHPKILYAGRLRCPGERGLVLETWICDVLYVGLAI